MKEKVLIIPRNDGIAISLGGTVYIVEMKAEQMFGIALRCQKAGLEMLRKEQQEIGDTMIEQYLEYKKES
jgi:hypothetical protein